MSGEGYSWSNDSKFDKSMSWMLCGNQNRTKGDGVSLFGPTSQPAYPPVTRQITSPTSSATSSDAPSGPIVTPTGRP